MGSEIFSLEIFRNGFSKFGLVDGVHDQVNDERAGLHECVPRDSGEGKLNDTPRENAARLPC
jgi:hypothetical protein